MAATDKQVAQVMERMQQITIPPERFHWDLTVLLLHPFVFWRDPAEPAVGALGGPAIAVPAALTPVHGESIEEVGCLFGTIPETMFTARMQVAILHRGYVDALDRPSMFQLIVEPLARAYAVQKLIPRIFVIPALRHYRDELFDWLCTDHADTAVACSGVQVWNRPVDDVLRAKAEHASLLRQCKFQLATDCATAHNLPPRTVPPLFAIPDHVQKVFARTAADATLAITRMTQQATNDKQTVIAFDCERVHAGKNTGKKRKGAPGAGAATAVGAGAQAPQGQATHTEPADADDGRRLVQLANNQQAVAFDLRAIREDQPDFTLADSIQGLLKNVHTVLVFGGGDEEDALDFFGQLPQGVHFLDLQALYVKTQLAQPTRLPFIGPKPALARVCNAVLGMPIDKSLQAGPWDGDLDGDEGALHERVVYAVLDSYVLIALWAAIDALTDAHQNDATVG